MILRCVWVCALVAATFAAGSAKAADDAGNKTLPRFASLRFDEVNLRAGPGERYPIEWVYRRVGYPVEIVAQFDLWRQIRDADGTVGWVHQTLLSGRRTALITGGVRTFRVEPGDSTDGIALAEPGVMVDLKTCEDEWCEVTARGYTGWLRRDEMWGVYPQETLR